MQKDGKVMRWDSARGFGFIRSPDTPADIFFHIRDFRGSATPHEGMPVTFGEIHVGGKGPRAMAVQPGRKPSSAASPGSAARATTAKRPPTASTARSAARPVSNAQGTAPTGAGLAYGLMLAWAALIAWGLWAQRLPLWTLAALAAVNVVTLWSYAADKNAARRGGWRTPEKHLHLLALLGGWPAAWLAQQNMRHKSRKTEFRAVYWGTLLANCTALAFWLLRDQPRVPPF